LNDAGATYTAPPVGGGKLLIAFHGQTMAQSPEADILALRVCHNLFVIL